MAVWLTPTCQPRNIRHGEAEGPAAHRPGCFPFLWRAPVAKEAGHRSERGTAPVLYKRKQSRRGSMAGSNTVTARIEWLIRQGHQYYFFSDVPRQRAWLTAAQSAVLVVCPSTSNPYNLHAQGIISKLSTGSLPQPLVSEMTALLEHLLAEINGGLLTTVENHAIALTFEDFLDHGAEYLKHGRKDEASVIAGIVFEDTVRRICRVLNIPENGVALETLIAELTKARVLTQLKARRARAASGLRTSAAHARREEFELGDVRPVIELTRELIAAHLG
jgi:hypothetical protein